MTRADAGTQQLTPPGRRPPCVAGRVAADQHTHRQPHEKAGDAPSTQHEQAARSVMHPDGFDPEWRYYHGAGWLSQAAGNRHANSQA